MIITSNKDGLKNTFLVVIGLCLVCSLIVSLAVVGLKPLQLQNKKLDVQRNILQVANLLNKDTDIEVTYAKFIKPRLVNLTSGEYQAASASEIENFSASNLLKDKKQSMLLTKEQDIAKIRTRANIVKIYEVYNEQGKITKYILPIYGNGLWSVMYAFVALEPNGRTIDGLVFYEHGETPGLGGEIENPKWSSQFIGKNIYAPQEFLPILKILKTSASPEIENRVDAISGATLTSNGVQNTLDFWFSKLGYRPFLEKLQHGGDK